MKKEKFLKELKKLNDVFEQKIYQKMILLVNEYIESEDKESFYNLQYESEIKKLDNMTFLTGLIIDKLSSQEFFSGKKGYSKSLTYKLRKALGYTY